MAFDTRWNPDPTATASVQFVGHRMVAIEIKDSRETLTLVPPTDARKWPGFVKLMRQVRDAAEQAADFCERHQSEVRSEHFREEMIDEGEEVSTQ
ncbi:hypothetical protein AB5J62_29120 [Amycolatopsis sp. cg5]|uniref:hypothetical protein n=1 Tax=Amycolatopsis sp. cg5 TaxID=3238802 RepID=UPI0035266F1A